MSARRPPLTWQGRAAIITGAASGIGLALARALAARGVDLAIADIDKDALEAARAELAATGRRIIARRVDVSDDEDVRAAAAAFDVALGPIHLLFNNAGIDLSGRLDALSLAEWQCGFGVNVFGVVHGLRHFLPLLRRHGGRAQVVNTASGAGFWVNADAAMGAYAATKFAVVAISEALEHELAGTPVGVCVLCPGPVATGIAARSDRASALLRDSIAAGTAPETVATLLLDAIERDDFYVFTPTRMADGVRKRSARILDAIARVPT